MTAGTGSEAARGAIVIVDDGRKLGFHSWFLLPKAAICDPELTLKLPPGLTAATGMDAIAHCMETFMAPACNPPADGIALDGVRVHGVPRTRIPVPTRSLRGDHLLARGFSVHETCLRQGRDLWEFMHSAVHAFIANTAPPSLMPLAGRPAAVPTG